MSRAVRPDWRVAVSDARKKDTRAQRSDDQSPKRDHEVTTGLAGVVFDERPPGTARHQVVREIDVVRRRDELVTEVVLDGRSQDGRGPSLNDNVTATRANNTIVVAGPSWRISLLVLAAGANFLWPIRTFAPSQSAARGSICVASRSITNRGAILLVTAVRANAADHGPGIEKCQRHHRPKDGRSKSPANGSHDSNASTRNRNAQIP